MRTFTYGLGILAALCLGVSAAVAAEPTSYKSFEKPEDAIAKNRLQYAVFVTRGEKIKDPKVLGDHDFAEHATVEVLAKDPHTRAMFKRVRGPFKTVAYLDDVMYTISAYRKGGVSMTIYLDEFDQTSVKLKGVRGSIHMETVDESR